MIDANADVNQPDGFGETPLISAAGAGSVEIVRMLCAAGANLNQVDDYLELTALEWARLMKQSEVVEILDPKPVLPQNSRTPRSSSLYIWTGMMGWSP